MEPPIVDRDLDVAARTSGGARPVEAPIGVCFPLTGDLAVGGGHVSLLHLLRRLDPARVRPLVVVHGEGPVRHWLSAQGITPKVLPARQRVLGEGANRARDALFVAATSWRLARFLRRRDIRIVHVNDPVMLATWFLAARLAGARLLWHQRGQWRQRRLYRAWLRVVDHVVAPSRFAAPPAKCTILPNPFETSDYDLDRQASRADLLAELQRSPVTRIVGFFANLDSAERRRIKCPEVFVATLAHLHARNPGLDLVGALFGKVSDDNRRELCALAQSLGIADAVRFMGFRHPVEPWLAACDVLLAPGADEGFGRTVVEAMLIGTPVVAADAGGYREIIEDGETGFLSPPGDPEGFAARVQRVVESPAEVAALTARARTCAIAAFGAERHATEIARVYTHLLAKDGPNGTDVPGATAIDAAGRETG